VLHRPRRYTSESKESQWKRLLSLIPKRKGAGRPLELDLRNVIDAIYYVLVTGCQGANLPKDYPNPNSVYYHYRKWSRDGTWQRINRALVYLERRRLGLFARPSAALIDSQSIKMSDQGGVSAYDGNKKIKGRKRHLLVDTLGNLLEVVVTAANLNDREGTKLLLTKVERQIALRLLTVWADKGYQGELELWFAQEWQIALEIVSAQADLIGLCCTTTPLGG
jgi:putative transposase